MMVCYALDFSSLLVLFLSSGASYSPYSQFFNEAVKEYGFGSSLFDVFLVGLIRSLVLFPLSSRVELFNSPPLQVFGLFLPLSSFVFLVAKLGYALAEGFSLVSGGEVFAGIIMGSQLLLTLLETYYAATIRSYLDRPLYSPLAQETDKERAERSRRMEEEGKSDTGILRLMGLVKPEAKIISVAMVALFINSMAQSALPFIVGIIVDALVEGDREIPGPADPRRLLYLFTLGLVEDRTPREQLNSSIVLLMIFFTIASIFGFIRAWLFTLAGQRVVARLRKEVFNSITRQEIGFFDRTRTGELTSRLTSDTQVIQNAVTTNISMLVRYLVQILISVVILVLLSWQLALVMFSIVPIVAIGAVVYGRFIQKLQKKFQDELANATSVAEEVISNVRTVRAFSKEVRSQGLYAQAVHKSYVIGRKIAIGYGAFNGVIGFIPQGAIALILWYGGTLVLDGEITTGLLTSFLLYTLSVAMAFAFLSGLFGDFMQAVGASSRIFMLMDRVPEIPTRGGQVIPSLQGQIEFQGVSFSYPVRPEAKVLSEVDLRLEPGSVLALVGPSGGGKSTVVSLMERFYDVTDGRILIDGEDIRTLDPEWFRSNVALVSQEPVLFANTIKENICYGVERSVDDHEVEAAAKAANAHTFVSAFPSGYDTQVGERGVRLSGGQKQRIAIARALLMDPRILLLDEATSALDAESEYLVQDAIEKAMKGRTVLIIAHRLSTVKNADTIAVLSGGKIVEMGSHTELVEKNGLYKKLVNRQMQTGIDSMDDVFAELVKEEGGKGKEEKEGGEKEEEKEEETSQT